MSRKEEETAFNVSFGLYWTLSVNGNYTVHEQVRKHSRCFQWTLIAQMMALKKIGNFYNFTLKIFS